MDSQKKIKAPQERSSSGKTSGMLLREARLKAKLSRHQLAEKMCLLEPTVIALEEDNLEFFAAQAYAKGHLLSCARRLGIPAEEMTQAFAELAASREQATQKEAEKEVTTTQKESEHVGPPLTMRVQGLFKQSKFTRKTAYYIGALLAPIVLYLVFVNPQAPSDRLTVGQNTKQTEQPQTASQQIVDEQQTLSSAPELSNAETQTPPRETASPEPEEQAAVNTTEAPVAATAADTLVEPQGEAIMLSFQFKDYSWLSVREYKTNTLLLHGMHQTGEKNQITARKPLRIDIGDANAVIVQIDGEILEIPPQTEQGSATITLR